jgi:hypothetical protein
VNEVVGQNKERNMCAIYKTKNLLHTFVREPMTYPSQEKGCHIATSKNEEDWPEVAMKSCNARGQQLSCCRVPAVSGHARN